METKRTCHECRQPFVIDDGERAWFVERDWPLPSRCKPCRYARRVRARERGDLVDAGDIPFRR